MKIQLLWLSVIVFSGCITVERPFPEKRIFTLETSDLYVPSEGNHAIHSGVLQVRRFQISPPYSEPEFIYRVGEREVETDFYNVFASSPNLLIQSAVQFWFSEANVFSHVAARESLLQPSHFLEAVVVTIHGDFRNLSAPKAVIEIHFTLNQDVSGVVKLIGSWKLRESISIENDSPQALVDGYSQGLAKILRQLVDEIQKGS